MISVSGTTLPQQITISWGGNDNVRLNIRYLFPKVWTQTASRSFGLYWSDQLAVGRLYPEPTPEELSSFYDIEKYNEYLSGGATERQSDTAILPRILRKIAWYLDKSEPAGAEFLAKRLTGTETVCDIGCGSGALLADLRPHVRSVTGVDPSASSLGALKAMGIEGFQGTAETLPASFSNRRFDLISMQQSLEHCLNPELALRNLRSICVEGGHCMIEVPNHENFGFAKYGPAWFHTDAGRHLNFFTAKSLCALLRHSGFEPLHVGHLSYTRQFSPEWHHAMKEVWGNLYRGYAHPPEKSPSSTDPVLDLLRSATLDRPKKYDVLRVYCSATQTGF